MRRRAVANPMQVEDSRELKFYCSSCGDHQPVEIEPLRKDDLNGDVAWGDIICRKCRFIIATVTSETEGILKFLSEDERGFADIALLRAEINDLRQDMKEKKLVAFWHA
jgi:hypothetical protein